VTPNEVLFLIGAGVFAVTGVLAAARQDMDVMSFIVIGVVTAMGGGTLRDVMLGLQPFWLQHSAYLYVPSVAALATFFFERRVRETFNTFLYLDAIATAVFTVIATERTLALGYSGGIAVLMGVITGIGGGVLRDLLTGQPTILLRRELSMTPIIVGGSLYVLVRGASVLTPLEESLTAIVVIAAVRAGAIRWRWAFPDWLTYRPASAPRNS
jgi:uncharacterized membrane protein YeiH